MCCIEPSITGPLPGMPGGKRAGEACVNLDLTTLECRIWNTAQYPPFCQRFTPEPEFCGESRAEAQQILRFLEADTRPAGG